MPSRVSVAELIDNDIPLRPDQAAAIVRDVCRQYAVGDLRGIPNPAVIRLTHEGAVVVEGPVSRDQSPVPAAAALLNQLLPGYNSPIGFKVPGGLRLLLARATGAVDLPPFASADDFSSALERFAAPDLSEVVSALLRSWAARRQDAVDGPSKELTISDIRRARRATGLSLEDVSRASAIPAAKLRELEWGYVRNWHADAEGRGELRRYARAAGLDEDLVVSVAWPLIENERDAVAADRPVEHAAWALVPSGPQTLTRLPKAAAPRPLLRSRWVLAVAAVALLAVAAASMRWEPPPAVPAYPSPVAQGPAPRFPEPAPQPVPASRTRDGVRSVSYASGPSPIERPTRPRVRKPRERPAREAPPPRQSFMKKELFRIVIR